jgi:hypothetical protein
MGSILLILLLDRKLERSAEMPFAYGFDDQGVSLWPERTRQV